MLGADVIVNTGGKKRREAAIVLSMLRLILFPDPGGAVIAVCVID